MFELIKNILDYYSLIIRSMFILYAINIFYILLKEKYISIRRKKEYEYYSNSEKYNEKYNNNLVIFNKIIKNNELYYNYFKIVKNKKNDIYIFNIYTIKD